MQKVKIEIISAEACEARLASARDAVSRHVSGPHLGDQEYVVALTGNYSANQFLGTAVSMTETASQPDVARLQLETGFSSSRDHVGVHARKKTDVLPPR